MEPTRYSDGDDKKALKVGIVVVGIAAAAVIALTLVLVSSIRDKSGPSSKAERIDRDAIAPDDRTVTVDLSASPCEMAKLTATETQHVVTLSLRLYANGKPCIDLAVATNTIRVEYRLHFA